MKDDNEICVVLCTCPPDAAPKIAERLVEDRRAACVNILPQVTSVYRWEGEVRRDGESLLVIKCSRAAARELERALVEAHPYDVPEVVVLDVSGGHPPYLEWVTRESPS